jgi:predicted DNA-binding protein (MmcQ/YjbR family)
MKAERKPRQKVAAGNTQTEKRPGIVADAHANGLEAELLRRLREICLALPEVKETVKWGHPTFEAGKKIFAVLDHYHGQPCIAFRALKDAQTKLRLDSRFFPAPYAAAQGWFCLRADGELNWAEIREHTLASYRLVALKRMLAAL